MSQSDKYPQHVQQVIAEAGTRSFGQVDLRKTDFEDLDSSRSDIRVAFIRVCSELGDYIPIKNLEELIDEVHPRVQKVIEG